MAGNMKLSKDVAGAKALLENNGYVVLKEASYRRTQERQRIAEALLRSEKEHNAGTTAWAHDCLDEERRLRDRCTFLYGQAMAHGATADELARDPESVRLANLSQHVSLIKTDLLEEIRKNSNA